jgi:hypothetical protein
MYSGYKVIVQWKELVAGFLDLVLYNLNKSVQDQPLLAIYDSDHLPSYPSTRSKTVLSYPVIDTAKIFSMFIEYFCNMNLAV